MAKLRTVVEAAIAGHLKHHEQLVLENARLRAEIDRMKALENVVYNRLQLHLLTLKSLGKQD